VLRADREPLSAPLPPVVPPPSPVSRRPVKRPNRARESPVHAGHVTRPPVALKPEIAEFRPQSAFREFMLHKGHEFNFDATLCRSCCDDKPYCDSMVVPSPADARVRRFQARIIRLGPFRCWRNCVETAQDSGPRRRPIVLLPITVRSAATRAMSDSYEAPSLRGATPRSKSPGGRSNPGAKGRSPKTLGSFRCARDDGLGSVCSEIAQRRISNSLPRARRREEGRALGAALVDGGRTRPGAASTARATKNPGACAPGPMFLNRSPAIRSRARRAARR